MTGHPADPDLVAARDDGVVLLASYSPAADRYFWPRRYRCPITFLPVDDVELAGRGTVWSWTYVNLRWAGTVPPSAGLGYGVALVNLPEGVRMSAVYYGEKGDLSIGDKVVLEPLYMSSGDDPEWTIAWRRQDIDE